MRHEMLFPVGPSCFVSKSAVSFSNPLFSFHKKFTATAFPPYETSSNLSFPSEFLCSHGPDPIATTVFHSKFLHKLVFPSRGRNARGFNRNSQICPKKGLLKIWRNTDLVEEGGVLKAGELNNLFVPTFFRPTSLPTLLLLPLS